jgi:hypothetical protein
VAIWPVKIGPGPVAIEVPAKVPVTSSPFAATKVKLPTASKMLGGVNPVTWSSAWAVNFPRWVACPWESPDPAPVTGQKTPSPEAFPLTGRSMPPFFASAEAGASAAIASARPASTSSLRVGMSALRFLVERCFFMADLQSVSELRGIPPLIPGRASGQFSSRRLRSIAGRWAKRLAKPQESACAPP